MSDRLDEERFSYTTTKDGRVMLHFEGRHVTTLAGKKAETFLARVAGLPPRRAQKLMASATGNFKR